MHFLQFRRIKRTMTHSYGASVLSKEAVSVAFDMVSAFVRFISCLNPICL